MADIKRAFPDDATLDAEALRVLARLSEAGACLAIARDMEKAVVVRDTADGGQVRTAIVDRVVAEALALRDWIETSGEARISRYRITAAGRMALKRLAEVADAADVSEPFSAQHREIGTREMEDEHGRRRRARYHAAESPLLSLSRRRDRDGNPFLSSDLVSAGERLREDFELAQMGTRTTQNGDHFMTAGITGTSGAGGGNSSQAAHGRVVAALGDLGPGLGDVVLRCCCYLEGLETVEKSLGWSARSGKIVLRIALTRLRRHFDELGDDMRMIG